MRCSECGYDAPESASFCESCGATLTKPNEQGSYYSPYNEPQNKFERTQNPFGGQYDASRNAYGQSQNSYGNTQNPFGAQYDVPQNTYGQTQNTANPQNAYARQDPYNQNTYAQNTYNQNTNAGQSYDMQQHWATQQHNAKIAAYRSHAITSMVFGILACSFFYSVILGIIFGCVALTKSNRSLSPLRQLNGPYGFAVAGRVLGIVGICLSALMLFIYIMASL